MNTNLNMQTMPIDRLKPAKYNPRKDLKPGDPAYEKIKRSSFNMGCTLLRFDEPSITGNKKTRVARRTTNYSFPSSFTTCSAHFYIRD